MYKPLIDKLTLLDGLQTDTKQLWGKMSAQHMIEHLILAVRTSNGKLNLGCSNSSERLPVLKKFLLSSRPLPRGFINPIIGEDLRLLEYASLDEAKKVLAVEVNDYYKYFEEDPNAVLTNPTFGELTKDEWEVFHEKHFTHHFGQFGIQY